MLNRISPPVRDCKVSTLWVAWWCRVVLLKVWSPAQRLSINSLEMQIPQPHPTPTESETGEGASDVCVQTLQVILMPAQAWEPPIWSVGKADKKKKCEVHRHLIVLESIWGANSWTTKPDILLVWVMYLSHGAFPSGLSLAKGQPGGEDLGLVGAEAMFQRDWGLMKRRIESNTEHQTQARQRKDESGWPWAIGQCCGSQRRF